MNNTGEVSHDTEIALVKQALANFSEKMDHGFRDIKLSLQDMATKSELRISNEQMNSRVNALLEREKADIDRQEIRTVDLTKQLEEHKAQDSERYSNFMAEFRRTTWHRNILTSIVSIIITALVVYVLNDLGVMR